MWNKQTYKLVKHAYVKETWNKCETYLCETNMKHMWNIFMWNKHETYVKHIYVKQT